MTFLACRYKPTKLSTPRLFCFVCSTQPPPPPICYPVWVVMMTGQREFHFTPPSAHTQSRCPSLGPHSPRPPARSSTRADPMLVRYALGSVTMVTVPPLAHCRYTVSGTCTAWSARLKVFVYHKCHHAWLTALLFFYKSFDRTMSSTFCFLGGFFRTWVYFAPQNQSCMRVCLRRLLMHKCMNL